MKSINDYVNNIYESKCEGIWKAIENDKYKRYDSFVDFLKDFYSPKDDEKAYKIEDEIHGYLMKMFTQLDKKYSK